MSEHKNRFDVAIVGESSPDRPPPSAGQALVNWALRKRPEHSHWLVLVLRCPQENFPLESGKQYALPKDLFHYGTFLGDFVELKWDGQNYQQPQTFRHGFQPEHPARTAAAALEALHQLNNETTDQVPASEVAGRCVYAGYLLDQTMGEVSWRKNSPVGAAAETQQIEAIHLAARVCQTLTVARIKSVCKEGSSLYWGAEQLIDAARKSESSELLYRAKMALQVGLHTHLPTRRPLQAELDSVAGLLAMAAEADRNYGPGTGERILTKVLGPQ